MIVQALVRHDHGYHGHDVTFNKNETLDSIIKQLELETIRVNNSANELVPHVNVLYVDKVIENSDGTLKLDSEGDRILERIYLNKEFSEMVSIQ